MLLQFPRCSLAIACSGRLLAHVQAPVDLCRLRGMGFVLVCSPGDVVSAFMLGLILVTATTLDVTNPMLFQRSTLLSDPFNHRVPSSSVAIS